MRLEPEEVRSGSYHPVVQLLVAPFCQQHKTKALTNLMPLTHPFLNVNLEVLPNGACSVYFKQHIARIHLQSSRLEGGKRSFSFCYCCHHIAITSTTWIDDFLFVVFKRECGKHINIRLEGVDDLMSDRVGHVGLGECADVARKAQGHAFFFSLPLHGASGRT